MPTEKQVQRAVKAMDKAVQSLEPFWLDDPNNSVNKLRSDLREYSRYLEKATWWRKGKAT